VHAERDLRPLFDPSSVAVVGGSDDPVSWGYRTATVLLEGAHRRPIRFVSRSKPSIRGHATVPRLADLPEPPELVVLLVPAGVLELAVGDAVNAGARAIVAITAGVGETGDEGRAVEQRMRDRVREAGAVLVGPNCMGVLDTTTELYAAPWIRLPPGDVAFASQSGNLAFDLLYRAQEVGVGFSRFVSLGNQADVIAADVVSACANDATTRVIAVYVEDFVDGRGFVRSALAARDAGIPVVVLSPVGTEAGARAARSHTGALASDDATVEAACELAGAFRVRTMRQMVDLIVALRSGVRPRGGRVALVTTGGGNAVIAAESLAAAGLEIPPLSEPTAAAVEASVPRVGARANPVDLIDDSLNDGRTIAGVARVLADSGEVDVVLMTGQTLSLWGGIDDDVARTEIESVPIYREVATRTGVTVIVNTDRTTTEAARAAQAAGVPVYRDPESVAAVLAAMVRATERPAARLPEIPAAHDRLSQVDGYWEARDVLAGIGITFAPALRVASFEEAASAAAELGYPAVLKAHGSLHKSDSGGVALDIRDVEALAVAWADQQRRLGPVACSVERSIDTRRGVELIVGSRWDPRFGPVALVGIGGVTAELVPDVRVALGPVDAEGSERLLRGLRAAPLLTGYRGRPAVDLAAASATLARLSAWASEHPEVREIEINPLLVTPEGVVGLDARILVEEDR
jgi:acetate---CoA ligase (ADP-forming)